ncbi:MAG: creatininase [Candidatus Limnocylindria bacterium]
MTDSTSQVGTPPSDRGTVLMSELTRPEYEAVIGESVVILPVGSTEQHGPHLPLGTDTIQVAEIAARVARQLPALVAPTIPYGYRSGARTGGGEIFCGTTSLAGETLTLLARDVLAALLRHGARRIAVLDGHYENSMFLSEAIHLALGGSGREDVRILKVLWAEAIDEETLERAYPNGFRGWGLEHAAHLETSVIGAIRPELIRRDAIGKDGVESLPVYDVYPQPEGLIPSSGVLSDPSHASERDGRLLLDQAVRGLVQMMRRELVEWTPNVVGGGLRR